MDDINRNTSEVIMHINNIFRFADPVFRLASIGAIKLLQFLARMVKEKRLSVMEFDDFGRFLKVTEGKYDIMNIPAIDKDALFKEMKNLNIHYSILPDLNKDDGLMQVAVYQPDRESFGTWYERYLVNQMQGGRKELKELRSLTRGNVSIVSFPLEGREDGMAEDFKALGINYARLPDLRVGDGSIQMEIANSDMGKVNQWYKLKQRDMLDSGTELPPIETITMEQYQQTGSMSEQDYLDTADKELKEMNKKYEGNEKGEVEQAVINKDKEIKAEMTSSYVDHLNDPDYIPVWINRESLIERSIVTQETRERFADRGQFCCRIPGTWEKDGQKEQILLTPMKDVYMTEDSKSFIAFLDKKHLPLVLYAGDGTPVREYFGVSAPEFAKKVFSEVDPANLSPDRIIDSVKNITEKATIHLRQPSPPIKVR